MNAPSLGAGARSRVAGPDRLLVERVAAGARVAVVGAPADVVEALRERGCEVLASGTFPSDDVLASFEPQALVLFDAGVLGAGLGGALRAAARLAPAPAVHVAFWNGSAASRLVAAVASASWPAAAVPEAAVRAVVAEAGFAVVERRAWAADAAPLLAPDTDRALRQLLAQVNAGATDDWIVYTARAEGAAPPLRPGLLTVVVRHHALERLALLEQAVSSLAQQRYEPLEIVVVSQSAHPGAERALTEALERHRGAGRYAYRVILHPSATDIRGRLLNLGVAAGEGQYLAFLDDDDVVYPTHYERLIAALRTGTAAWSVAQTVAAHFSTGADGALRCLRKEPFTAHERFSLPDLARGNYIPTHAYVLDRLRLGAFRIAFSEEVTRLEDYSLLLRLAGLFRPVFLAEGPTCEYRMRDDGSNTTPLAEQPPDVRARERAAWEAASVAIDAEKQRGQVLVSWAEYAADLAAEHARGLAERLYARHRVADHVDAAVRKLLPPAHRALRAVAALLTKRS